MAPRAGDIFLGSHLHGNSIMMRFEPKYPGQKLTLKPFDNTSILPAMLVKLAGLEIRSLFQNYLFSFIHSFTSCEGILLDVGLAYIHRKE